MNEPQSPSAADAAEGAPSSSIPSRADEAELLGEHCSFWSRPDVVGTCLGVLSALAYTAANLGLRKVAGGDLDWAIFVVANKTSPVAAIAWGLILWRVLRGQPGLPPRELIVPLIVTGLVMQFGGNMMFQFALSRGGLALTVPLTFSTIILSGAVLGRLLLKEPITPRLLLAMATMIGAVVVLSQGAQAASGAVVEDADWGTTALAVVAACLSGCGYGSCGVMIRRCVTQDLSYTSTIVLISSIGPLVMGPLAVAKLGMARISTVPAETWLWMLAAGIANAVAFYAVNGAYKYLSVLRVNLINCSQAAMAAALGVVLFAEPNTWALQFGTALTVLGLILSTRRKRVSEELPSSPEDSHTTPSLVSNQDHVA